MPRPRTPTNLAYLRGVDKKHPERMRDRRQEPKPGPFPKEPPEHLPQPVKDAWRDFVGLVAPGVLGASDVVVVELAATLWAELRALSITMKESRMAQLRLLCHEFGMTPAARSKVTAPQKPENPFDDV